MIINFTNAVLTAENKTVEVIVPGIVQTWSDLAGFRKFEDFMCTLTDDSIIGLSVTVYGCDCEAAEISGIASLLIRIARDYRFVAEYCTELSKSFFKFAWSPSMQCGVDL